MSKPKIQKTVYTYVVIHTEDDAPQDIQHALAESYDGSMVGLEVSEQTTDIPDDKVVDELVALGNDGSFLDVWWGGYEED